MIESLPKIIGICGLIGSGKDTVASFIQEIFPQYENAFFADNLKKSICAMYGWDYNRIKGLTPEDRYWREQPDEYWSNKLGYDVTPRNVMQKIGPLMRNNINSAFWVYSLEKTMPKFTLLTDVRYAEEIDLVRRYSGIIIEVDRGEKPFWWSRAIEYNEAKLYNRSLHFDLDLPQRKAYLDNLAHESEYSWAGINKPDYIINNNSTLNDLKQEVYNLCNKLKEKYCG